MSSLVLLASLLVLFGAVYGVVRGRDVRLVLLVAGLALGGLALRPWIVLDAFARTMGDGKIVGPICSAMGFSFVLRRIGSDRELVRLLVKPIRHIRWLLVPGGAAVGFVANMAITSQTAAAAAVGPILVPIMLAAGWHPILVGATLVLGCSGGGNLNNPGEPDIVTVQSATGAPLIQVLDRVLLPELVGFSVAVLVFILLCRRTPSEHVEPPIAFEEEPERPVKMPMAVLPLLPIALLLLLQPRLRLVPALLELYPDGLPVVHAMVFSTLVAMVLRRRDASAEFRAFFEGMGFAFVHVISLIIAASCLIAGMEAVGLVQVLVGLVSGEGTLFADRERSHPVDPCGAVGFRHGAERGVFQGGLAQPQRYPSHGRRGRGDHRRHRRHVRPHDVPRRGRRDLLLHPRRMHADADRATHGRTARRRVRGRSLGDGSAVRGSHRPPGQDRSRALHRSPGPEAVLRSGHFRYFICTGTQDSLPAAPREVLFSSTSRG